MFPSPILENPHLNTMVLEGGTFERLRLVLLRSRMLHDVSSGRALHLHSCTITDLERCGSQMGLNVSYFGTTVFRFGCVSLCWAGMHRRLGCIQEPRTIRIIFQSQRRVRLEQHRSRHLRL